MKFSAKTVEECWVIIREETEKWQDRANHPNPVMDREICLLIRDALDNVSLRILYGEKKYEQGS